MDVVLPAVRLGRVPICGLLCLCSFAEAQGYMTCFCLSGSRPVC
jgi:hypothetical protein